jgi:hypothetical protein
MRILEIAISRKRWDLAAHALVLAAIQTLTPTGNTGCRGKRNAGQTNQETIKHDQKIRILC